MHEFRFSWWNNNYSPLFRKQHIRKKDEIVISVVASLVSYNFLSPPPLPGDSTRHTLIVTLSSWMYIYLEARICAPRIDIRRSRIKECLITSAPPVCVCVHVKYIQHGTTIYSRTVDRTVYNNGSTREIVFSETCSVSLSRNKSLTSFFLLFDKLLLLDRRARLIFYTLPYLVWLNVLSLLRIRFSWLPFVLCSSLIPRILSIRVFD
jgi:hypothetical protein